ncbi:MAG: hypothetical protein AAGB31_02570 [Bdellovibrio sp.]
MRVLCINFKTPQENSCAEAFLIFSPRVQFRFPHFVFVDIESTSHFFGGESTCLQKALGLAQQLSAQASVAIADSPPVAQLLALWRPNCITSPGHDSASLKGLGLDALKELEGLNSWTQKKSLEHMISVFHSLGVHTLEETLQFRLNSLRDRWGDMGVLLWKRLHGDDSQVISPLIPGDPLVSYGYLDDPINAVSLVMQALRPHLNLLFARITGLARYVRALKITLYCEYSETQYQLTIEPVTPTRDQILFEDLLEKKLSQIVLENPVREFEISLQDVPEKVQQLDFFLPRETSEDRWRRLISFARQAECEMGFLQMQASHFPEKSFSLITDWPEEFISRDDVRWDKEAVQIKSVYAKGLNTSPRPSLLLPTPQALSAGESQKLKFLSSFPSERIESSWWQTSGADLKNRDYYFALSAQGQLLWVFRDRLAQ